MWTTSRGDPEYSGHKKPKRTFPFEFQPIEISGIFGKMESTLPYHLHATFSSFQSLVSRKQLREIEVQMVSAISFGWFADFGKTLSIIQRSSQPVYSDKW